ncbi:MAG: hypothetical protein BGO03_01275 [Mesorhizobium sp. 61-13]|nr:MAG: hypothetical protein BGO03_01275 [Mesorhizobium sp. 61-13]
MERYARRDQDLAALAPLDRANSLHRSLEMIEALRRFLEEPLACRRWPDAGVAALKQCRTDVMLKTAHSLAHARLLNVQCRCRTPKTTMLGGDQRVSEKSQIEGVACQ